VKFGEGMKIWRGGAVSEKGCSFGEGVKIWRGGEVLEKGCSFDGKETRS